MPHFIVHHEHRIWSRADHPLDRRADEDIPQQLFAVRAHHDEIGLNRARGPQNAVERITEQPSDSIGLRAVQLLR